MLFWVRRQALGRNACEILELLLFLLCPRRLSKKTVRGMHIKCSDLTWEGISISMPWLTDDQQCYWGSVPCIRLKTSARQYES